MTNDQLLTLFRIIFNLDDNSNKWKEKVPDGTDVRWGLEIWHCTSTNDVYLGIGVTLHNFNDGAKIGKSGDTMSIAKMKHKDYDYLFKAAYREFREQ